MVDTVRDYLPMDYGSVQTKLRRILEEVTSQMVTSTKEKSERMNALGVDIERIQHKLIGLPCTDYESLAPLSDELDVIYQQLIAEEALELFLKGEL